jgi:6-phospho-beta-glucosidase
MKICVIGCGLRTPLLIHGLVHSGMDLSRIVLYDSNAARTDLMVQMGRSIAAGTPVKVSASAELEEAVQDAAFVISSIRVGDMKARARDERLAVEVGFAGQETTGPAGFTMALRTIPIAIQHAKIVQRYAPGAWIISFTNPAGIITQALSLHTGVRVVGICDTPAELIHQIRRVVAGLEGVQPNDVECTYFGLNHLGWVRDIRVGERSLLDRLLEDDHLLREIYPADLFSPALLRELRLIPTEYLYYYYYQQRALANQIQAGATRGEELAELNTKLLGALHAQYDSGDNRSGLATYREYLNRRNRSYMQLDGAGESAFDSPDMNWDPFTGPTGYHRIAVETIRALTSTTPHRVALNVPNQGAIQDLATDDVVEVPCLVDRAGARPQCVGQLPQTVRALVLSVKNYELLTVRAAIEQRRDLAAFALMANPIVGSWDLADRFVRELMRNNPDDFGKLN